MLREGQQRNCFPLDRIMETPVNRAAITGKTRNNAGCPQWAEEAEGGNKRRHSKTEETEETEEVVGWCIKKRAAVPHLKRTAAFSMSAVFNYIRAACYMQPYPFLISAGF